MAKLIEDTIGKDDFQLRVAYRTRKTQSFFSNKDKVSKELQSKLFIPMIVTYVQNTDTFGETIRHFSARMTDEKGPTEISSHVQTSPSLHVRNKH